MCCGAHLDEVLLGFVNADNQRQKKKAWASSTLGASADDQVVQLGLVHGQAVAHTSTPGVPARAVSWAAMGLWCSEPVILKALIISCLHTSSAASHLASLVQPPAHEETAMQLQAAVGFRTRRSSGRPSQSSHNFGCIPAKTTAKSKTLTRP